ncbi:MAG: T9SS type A sorting domain-containing protein, partial [Candidatus Marinimicrobia bacterium]|nr:T9SS type A sorting domain-containing protein [Candidatus Neomarinimicrobiota bacterium]
YGETNWHPATMLSSNTILPTMVDSVIIWRSDQDIAHRVERNVHFRVLPSDKWSAGVADTIIIDIDNENGPIVTDWSPDIGTGQKSLWFDVIDIQFDQDVDTNSLAGNIAVSGTRSGNMLFDIDIQNPREIILIPESYYTALETLTVELQSGITNLWGTQLDGNQNGDPDGTPEDDFTFQFRTGMLADYDANNSIELADFDALKTAWTGSPKDYTMELGPVTGDIPYFKVQPDGVFDLSDLMVLVSMWNWSFDHSPDIMTNLALAKPIDNDQSSVSLISNYERNGVWNATLLDGLCLDLRVQRGIDMRGLECLIKYNPAILEYQDVMISAIPEEERKQWIILSRNNTENGIVAITLFPMFKNVSKISDYSRLGSVSFSALTDCEAEVLYQLTTLTTLEDSVVMEKFTSKYRFETQPEIPRQFALHQNFPNPFNPTTKIRYELPKECDVKLAVFNIRGELVKWVIKDHQQPGYYEIEWNGHNDAGHLLSSGIYLYRLQAGTYLKTQKMVLMK